MDFKASVQYNDWKGTAAADGNSLNSIHDYLEGAGLKSENEFLISVSCSAIEFHPKQGEKATVRAYLLDGKDFESVQHAISSGRGKLPVRIVNLEMTPDEFISLFKRFDIVLNWRGLALEDREFEAMKSEEE